jgi:uncharacterized protein (DUF4415 family)
MRKKPPDVSQEDWDDLDIPEWTEEDFARARPFKEVFPEQFAAWEKKRMGRPPAENPKVQISFRLASDVVDGIRASGRATTRGSSGYCGRRWSAASSAMGIPVSKLVPRNRGRHNA